MTTDEVRKMITAQPFRPFALHLADGRMIEIQHPEFLAVSPVGRTTIVFHPEDTFEILDTLLVTSIRVLDGKKPRRQKRS